MKPGSESSSSFCVVPWVHRLVSESGFLKVCCVAEGPENFLTDSQGKRLHIQGGESDEEVFNNPRLKELRRAMLEGEWHPMCGRCLRGEQAAGNSSRTARNNRFRHIISDLLSNTAADGAITAPRIRHLDMRLGNYCNLTCRMCSPGASKLWIEPYNRVQPPQFQVGRDRLAVLRNIEWVSDPAVWLKFRDQLPSIEWLHFAGGEPMMIPEMIHALRICVDSGCARGIDLSYNTNITLLPESVGELWPQFKSVSLTCSIDGYGPLNEYIRRPSRWRDVDRHLHTLDAHVRDWNLRRVSVTSTVQVYNVLDLDKLYAYLRSEFEHVFPAPSLNPLSWPAYLSVQNLPPHIKSLARERLLKEKTREEYKRRDDIGWLMSSIDTLVAHMDGASLTDHWKDFVFFTANSEREFGDSFARAAPEMAALLAETAQGSSPEPPFR